MSHPLDGVALRIERAIKHFDELEKMFVSFREANIDKVSIGYDPGPPQRLPVFFDPSLVIPLRLSLPVSDCIHNLRGALDYLIFELSILDSGTIQKGTQFPIEDNPQVFHQTRRNTSLRGLSDDHVRAIEFLQPYNGVEWTKSLRSISNPDKHQHLVIMKPQLSSSIFAHSVGDIDDFEFSVNGEQMYVKKKDVFSIGFSDSESPVIETLNSLQVRVRQTIDAFKPEFK